MSIEPPSGVSHLIGVRDRWDESRQGTSFEELQAEDLLLVYLVQNHDLDPDRARRVIAAIVASGESLSDLMLQLRRKSAAALTRIQAFIDQVD